MRAANRPVMASLSWRRLSRRRGNTCHGRPVPTRHTYSHGHIRDYDWEVVDTAAARVAAAVDLNEAMDALAAVAPEGLRLLTGQYSVMGRKLRWDNDEAHWYTGTRQREEPLSVVAVRLAPSSMPSLRIPLLGEPVPEHAGADDLPF